MVHVKLAGSYLVRNVPGGGLRRQRDPANGSITFTFLSQNKDARQEEAFVPWEIYSEAGVFLAAWRARLVRWLSEPQGGRKHLDCLFPSEVF